MVDLKGEDEDSIDAALTQQVNTENSSKEDKLETAGDPENPIKRQEPAPKSEQKPNYLKIIIIVSIIVLAVILLAALILSAVMLLKDKEESRILDKGANIKEAKIADEKTAYVTLSDSVDLTKLQEVEIVFSDDKNNDYAYSSSQISQQYEITPSAIGLGSFENITSVSASFTFKSTPAPSVNNTNTTNNTFVMCTDSCTSLGKTCGNWSICNKSVSCGNCSSGVCNSTGQCPVSCSDECANEGLSCQGSMRYNCSVGTDRCLHRTNLTACGTEETCSNGACVAVAECSSNSTCFSNTSFTNICSIGFCNSASKCQAIYNSSAQICRNNVSECDMASSCTASSGTCPANINKTDGTTCSLGFCKQGKCAACLSDSNCSADGCNGTEYRDYFCNSTNSCQYNIITKEENLTNGNCEDRIDNDCDGLNDTAGDPGCAVPICGNNIKEGTEACDGADLAGKTCADFECGNGCIIECLTDCSDYDIIWCPDILPSMSPFARFWEWVKNLF
ncbi:hypothetical protein A3K73_08370 [Candidatus Pacearchaeota archaeon RBG_13_36_9]|nr:MAG: hypothetical protein A3K73_08370 [Candidatus Pacearchaeota archaeon RBG_13_36_9]